MGKEQQQSVSEESHDAFNEEITEVASIELSTRNIRPESLEQSLMDIRRRNALERVRK